MARSGFAQLRWWMSRNPLIAHLLAITVFIIAFAIRSALGAALPPGFPYLTFFPAVILTTFICGTMPGIVGAGLGLMAAWYYFIPPFHSFALTPPTLLAVLFYIFIVAVDIAVIDRMLRAIDELDIERRRALDFAMQRDALFKELQHRVGNNLNMVSSMLSIQSRSIADGDAKNALHEGARRIGLIADINRMFIDPANSDGRLDKRFIMELGQKCLDAAGVAGRVAFSAIVKPVELPQSRFMPVSLILAESINNAIEHGLNGADQGYIRVDLSHDDNMATLVIANNGHVLDPAFDLAETRSIGLVLVQSFARQLGGSFAISASPGETHSTLTFPLRSE